MEKDFSISVVETIDELIQTYDGNNDFSAAFVLEHNCYVVAIPYQDIDGDFTGYTGIADGGFLGMIVSESKDGHRIDYYIYMVEKEKVQIYLLSGGIFEVSGSRLTFDFFNTKLFQNSIQENVIEHILQFVKDQDRSNVDKRRIQ